MATELLPLEGLTYDYLAKQRLQHVWKFECSTYNNNALIYVKFENLHPQIHFSSNYSHF